MLELSRDWKMKPSSHELIVGARIVFSIKNADDLEGTIKSRGSKTMQVSTQYGDLTVNYNHVVAVHKSRKVRVDTVTN